MMTTVVMMMVVMMMMVMMVVMMMVKAKKVVNKLMDLLAGGLYWSQKLLLEDHKIDAIYSY